MNMAQKDTMKKSFACMETTPGTENFWSVSIPTGVGLEIIIFQRWFTPLKGRSKEDLLSLIPSKTSFSVALLFPNRD